jgi:hypothetical protein
MRRCPACGNTYTNDELVFCLEDGARLVRLSDARSGFDAEATLHLPAEEDALPSEGSLERHRAPTLRQSASPQTVPPRTQPRTMDNQASVAASSPKSTSRVVVAGITAIVVLLLVIAGLGIALLVRNSSSSNSNAGGVENGNGAANRDSNRNASNTSNNSTGNYNSANRTNSNAENRNGSTQTGPFGRAEAKVVRGSTLEESDLSALSREELRKLRNAVYARHGRMFDSPDLQSYFDKRPWYRPRSDYDETQLTETDRANIKLIQSMEGG